MESILRVSLKDLPEKLLLKHDWPTIPDLPQILEDFLNILGEVSELTQVIEVDCAVRAEYQFVFIHEMKFNIIELDYFLKQLKIWYKNGFELRNDFNIY